MSSKGALLLAGAIALAPIPDTVEAKGIASVGKAFANARRAIPKPATPSPIIKKSPIPASLPGQPILQTTSSVAKRTLDVIAPRDDFMKYWLAGRAAIAGTEYVALTPTNLDAIAGAQYQAILSKESGKVLPENHPTTQRIKHITDKLIRVIKTDPSISPKVLQRMKWEVHVIDSKTVNAFCMPSGKMVIYTGIINKLNMTDDEIAVVMGHEIAHALRDHSYTRIKTQLATNTAISAAGAITGRQMYAFDIANSLWQLSHSRDHEREADHDGLDIARMAGYDPCAGENVWKKMRQLSRSSPPEFLSTHPDSAERAESLRKQAKSVGGKC